jgi:hypothetical protein
MNYLKKGSIVANKYVGIILLVASLALLMAVLFFAFGDESELDREMCHDSVIFRGTLPDILDMKNIPSLACKTKKICITDKLFLEGDCEGELGKDFKTIRITSNSEKQDEEMNRILAREWADCWAMMGEGKIQVFPREITDKKRCSICTIIAFDEELKKKKTEFSGFGVYLSTKAVPHKTISYASFLNFKDTTELLKYNTLTTKQKAILFIELDNNDLVSNIGGVAGFAVGAIGSWFTKIGFVTGAQVTGIATIAGRSAGGYIQDDLINKGIVYYSGSAFVDYDEKSLKGLNCDPFDK